MKINMLEIILMGFATWRIASLLTKEEGPFGMFVRFREWFGIEHTEEKEPFMFPDNFFAKLLECIWCVSVWVAGGFVLLYIFLPQFAILVSLWLGLSTIAIIVDKYV